MTEPTRITPNDKAKVVCDLIKGGEQVREGQRLVVLRGPSPVEGGFEVWAQLYDKSVKVDMDQHRVFINPPTQIVVKDKVVTNEDTGEFEERVVRQDPAEAFWTILWDSVLTTPNPRDRRKR